LIDATHPIELDGVKYKLAATAEGDHHDVAGESLNPANAVTVQGEEGQKFQLRPDILLWSWTDWSQGEGRRKYKQGEAGRSWQLNSVRAFEEPGHLIPGYYVESTQDSSGAADFASDIVLVPAIGALYGMRKGGMSNDYYLWDETNEKWGAATTLTGVTYGCQQNAAVGDSEYVYWMEATSGKLWKFDGTAAPTAINTADLTTIFGPMLAQLGPYVYVADSGVTAGPNAVVWEVPKSGAAAVQIDSWTESGESLGAANGMAVVDGKVYVLTSGRNRMSIREIIPSTAAGAGYGAEIATVDGFQADSMWSHAGNLFVAGRYQTNDTHRTILYFPPGGNYGTLGSLRDGELLETMYGGGSRMIDHFFWSDSDGETGPFNALWQVDSVTGGVARLGHNEDAVSNGQLLSMAVFNGDIFQTNLNIQQRTSRAMKGSYTKSSSAISSEHDFDLAGEKYLSSILLSTEAMIADWTVYVDYMLDNDGTWTTAVTQTTDGATQLKAVISTDASTVTFGSLKLRIRFVYGGAGVPTTAPVVLGVDCRAGVTEKLNVFRYQLDLSDDHSSGGRSQSGRSKAASFLATAQKTTVLDLKDGYDDRNSGEFTQYDVTVGSYRKIMKSPSEGVGHILLKEVV